MSNLIGDELRAHDGPGWMLFSNDVQGRAEELGMAPDDFRESMHALEASRRINVQTMAGGERWMLRPFPTQSGSSSSRVEALTFPGRCFEGFRNSSYSTCTCSRATQSTALAPLARWRAAHSENSNTSSSASRRDGVIAPHGYLSKRVYVLHA